MTNRVLFPPRGFSRSRALSFLPAVVSGVVAAMALVACTTASIPRGGNPVRSETGADGALASRSSPPPFDAEREEAVVQAAVAGASDLERAALASGWARDGARAFAVERYADSALSAISPRRLATS